MPYIKQGDRDRITRPSSVGELNYYITTLCKNYLDDHGERYQVYNDIIGALECAKLELYRRKVASYENLKIIENGDVY